MKKVILVIVVLFTALSFGQRIQGGGSQLNAGLGFSSGYGTPIYLGFDYGVHSDITVGAKASFVTYSNSNGKTNTAFGLGANVNYHFNRLLEIPNDWDVYAGVTLLVHPLVDLRGQLGVRYFISNKLAVNFEFGATHRYSAGQIGITYKI